MNKFILLLSGALLCLFISGCATPQKLNTPSGRPEVTINSTDRGKIKSIIINEFMNSGYSIISESDYSLIFSKAMTGTGGIMYQAMLGNQYSSSPEWNARINMSTINNTTRVIGQMTAKMQNAFGREDVNDMTEGKAGGELQEVLYRVKVKSE